MFLSLVDSMDFFFFKSSVLLFSNSKNVMVLKFRLWSRTHNNLVYFQVQVEILEAFLGFNFHNLQYNNKPQIMSSSIGRVLLGD